MNRNVRWSLLATAVVAILGLSAFLWHVRQQSQEANQNRGRFGLGAPMAVAVATATTGDIPVVLAALGTITPLATVTVKTQVSGQLQEIGFKEGQALHKGDFLAQIDSRPFQNSLAQAEGVLARDQAQLANAKLDLKRYSDLLNQSLVARQQVDTQQAVVEQLTGTVATDTAQVNTARLNLQYAHIVSPIDGRAGLRQVDVGNYVTAGDANGIVVITQLQPVTAIFPIPEDSVPQLMKRVRAGASLEVKAFDRANASLLATGKLVTVDNEMDTTTGTVKLRAVFDNKDELLFPNQFVNIHLLVDTLHDQVIVPAAAIQHGSVNGVAGTFVYGVNPDSTVTVRAVTVGETDGDRVAITRGLAAGDTVVTEGGDRLRDGARVQLPGAEPAAQPRAPGANRRGNGNGNGNANGKGNGAGRRPRGS